MRAEAVTVCTRWWLCGFWLPLCDTVIVSDRDLGLARSLLPETGFAFQFETHLRVGETLMRDIRCANPSPRYLVGAALVPIGEAEAYATERCPGRYETLFEGLRRSGQTQLVRIQHDFWQLPEPGDVFLG